MTRDEIAGLLARTELFGSLPATALGDVAEDCFTRTYRRGQSVFSEGDAGDTVFVVASGRVNVIVATPEGGSLVFVTLAAPQTFGELAVLDGGPRSATVRAADATTLVGLRRASLHGLLSRHPELTRSLLGFLGSTIRRLTEQAGDLVFLDLHGRVAKRLLQLAGGATEVALAPTQTELAAMVGGSRQSVNQILRSFERRSWIRSAGGAITLLDVGALRRRASP